MCERLGIPVKPKRKTRISVAIDKEIPGWIDGMVEKRFFAGLSHATCRTLPKPRQEVTG